VVAGRAKESWKTEKRNRKKKRVGKSRLKVEVGVFVDFASNEALL